VPVVAGSRLGPYEVLSLLGSGGMGEVWKARDTTLDRDVALKILPEAFALDADRLPRFKREAQVLASLNHPHIGAIYGFEESGGTYALVLELVDGPTLADRIARGAIPVEEALSLGQTIAGALETAHERGIVHRDLKPANIKVRPDGTVKVLDFGLAKSLEPAAAGAGLTASPTLMSPAVTGRGVILGTAAYMSPEQAKGLPADKRSDIWSFGCVLFEMLAGRRPFKGDTVSEALAAVLKDEPSWDELPSGLSPIVQRLLRRCLAKEPRQRLPDIGVARLDLDEALQSPAGNVSTSARAPHRRRHSAAAWVIAAVLLLATVGLAVGWARSRASMLGTTASEMRVDISTPPLYFNRFVLSPDGTKIAYVAGGRQLWLRSLASTSAQKLADFGEHPFWSTDSQSIGFFGNDGLKRLDLATGLVQPLASAPIGIGGSWSRDGTILFVPSQASTVHRISASGRDEAEATRLAPGQVGHRFPRFLPDGRHFLFLAMGTPEARGVFVGSLDSTDTHRLLETDTPALFAPPDSVFYASHGALVVQRLDLRSFTLTGDVVPMAPHVAFASANYNAIAVSASDNGRVAYMEHGGRQQFIWLNRLGERVATLGDPAEMQPYSAHISSDGRAVVTELGVDGDTDVWTFESERGIRRRLTHDPARQAAGVWSPDGRHVVFASERTGLFAIHEVSADGADEVVLSASSQPRVPHDWSPDNRFIVFMEQAPVMGNKLWVLPLAGDRTPVRVTHTPGTEADGRFSPDSHWIAFTSLETGRGEVYVRPFPEDGPVLQISTAGGGGGLWARNGRELFYVDSQRHVQAVPLMLDGPRPKIGTPTALFDLAGRRLFDVSPDGQRFLALEQTEPPPPITLVLNWPGLRH
jgi:serine/threonine protein kinase/Tol biopolymer transport system component